LETMTTDFKILVLNADFQPINMTSFKKGYKLVYKGKAEVVVSDEKDEAFFFATYSIKPKVIRLLQYIYLPHRRLNLSKQNIFKRDKHACVYCESRENLTLDHVLPRSRGGKNTWENLVTCCSKCNSKKDNKTPEEAGMKPFVPTFSNLMGFSKDQLFAAIMSNDTGLQLEE
jgi:hypothetical protein